jgi:hypothetical protein
MLSLLWMQNWAFGARLSDGPAISGGLRPALR